MKSMETEPKTRLEDRVANTCGILVGAGLTAAGCYYPELIPYMVGAGVAVAVGAGVGAVGSADAVAGVAFGTTVFSCVALSGIAAGAVGAVGAVGVGVGAVGAVGVGIAVGAEKPAEFVKRFLTYGVLSSALVFGGNYLGRNKEVRSAVMPAGPKEIGMIILTNKQGVDTTLYEHGTKDKGRVYLPKEEIIKVGE